MVGSIVSLEMFRLVLITTNVSTVIKVVLYIVFLLCLATWVYLVSVITSIVYKKGMVSFSSIHFVLGMFSFWGR